MLTFCQPVVTAPAVIRGGAVLASGWLPEFVRFGELERHLGAGVIESVVSAAVRTGGCRRRSGAGSCRWS